MEALLIYIAKVCAGVILLFGVYAIFLRNEKFFRLNRIILLMTITLPFFLPLLPASPFNTYNVLTQHVVPLHEISPGERMTENTGSIRQSFNPSEQQETHPIPSFFTGWSWQQLIARLYIAVLLVLLTRLLYRMYRVFTLIRKNDEVMIDNIPCRSHHEDHPPFSFLHYLVINRNAFNDEELRRIILHERSHIRQWHTIDILAAELVHVLLWINPLMPAVKRHIRLNLEYLADENVLAAGTDPKNYQLSILNTAMSRSSSPLINLFNSSKLKQRIAMMNASETPRMHLYKYLLVVVMIAATYIAVNPASAAQQENDNTAFLQDLKKFEGYYQFDQDNEIYVQIFIKDNRLVLKQLWDNKEIVFTRNSEMDFVYDEKFTLVFSKNDRGEITSLLAFGRDKWNRIANYKPVVKKEIKLSADQLNALAGMYKLKDNQSDLFIKFFVQGNYLVAKEMWTGKEIIIIPEAPDTFFGKDQRYPVQFRRDANGKIEAAIIFKKDVWEKTDQYQPKKEVTIGKASLRAVEGKYRYQFEKDKYSYIEITREGNGLLVTALWDNKQFHFVPESATSFFSREQYVTARFSKSRDGKVTHALIFDHDLWEKVN